MSNASRIAAAIGTALLATTVALAAPRAPAPGYTFVRSLGGIEEYRLDTNGLTVLLKRDATAPVTTFNIGYFVGSRNEGAGTTGSAHLLEHIMFKGTDRHNDAQNTGLRRFVRVVGAQFNGGTGVDLTNYYATMGRDFLEEYAAIEADRMRHARFNAADLKSEMTVVRNEYERNENDPHTTLRKEVTAMAFMAHPYHHPTIGWRSDIENVPMAKLRELYDAFYWPNNATVVIVGDIETQATLAMIQKHFGAIPRSPGAVAAIYTEEPDQTAARRVTVQRPGEQSAIVIGYRIPNGLHGDLPALDVLASILGGSRNSRLQRALVDDGLAVMAGAGAWRNRDPGLFSVSIMLAPGKAHRDVEERCLQTIARLRDAGVTAEEVGAAVRHYRMIEALNTDGMEATGSWIMQWVAAGDWTRFANHKERMARVTAADVQRVAREYLRSERSTTGWLLPLTETSSKKAALP